MDAQDLERLRARMGDEYLGRRLHTQVTRMLQLLGQGRGGLHYENVEFIMRTLDFILRVTGLNHLGTRNALDIQVRENRVTIPNLPAAFENFRVAHFSDLHLDGYPGLGKHFAGKVADQMYDVAVLTGDYRFHTTGDSTHVEQELRDLVGALRERARHGVFGILGNHDFIEMVPVLEAVGVQTLLNESAALKQNDSQIWLVGLDDAHFYGAYDFDKALSGVSNGDARIALIHSPEIIPEASERGFALYLTGHTHGGQVCLPGGTSILANARCARKYLAGAWSYNGMTGYTSRGTGSSGVFARFFCPPEIVIHTLTR